MHAQRLLLSIQVVKPCLTLGRLGSGKSKVSASFARSARAPAQTSSPAGARLDSFPAAGSAKFWLSFVLIWVLLTVGTLVIHTYARKDGIEPDYLESLFATYSLFSLESVYPMPKAWAARGCILAIR